MAGTSGRDKVLGDVLYPTQFNVFDPNTLLLDAEWEAVNKKADGAYLGDKCNIWRVTNNNNQIPLMIQTPRMYAPFGINQGIAGGGGKTIQLRFPTDWKSSAEFLLFEHLMKDVILEKIRQHVESIHEPEHDGEPLPEIYTRETFMENVFFKKNKTGTYPPALYAQIVERHPDPKFITATFKTKGSDVRRVSNHKNEVPTSFFATCILNIRWIFKKHDENNNIGFSIRTEVVQMVIDEKGMPNAKNTKPACAIVMPPPQQTTSTTTTTHERAVFAPDPFEGMTLEPLQSAQVLMPLPKPQPQTPPRLTTTIKIPPGAPKKKTRTTATRSLAKFEKENLMDDDDDRMMG